MALVAPVIQDSTGARRETTGTDALRLPNSAPFQAELVISPAGATPSIDFKLGQKSRLVLSANATITLVAPQGIGNYQTLLVQDSTIAYTVSWPAGIKWPGGTAHTMTASLGAIDIVCLYFDGTDWYATAVQDFK